MSIISADPNSIWRLTVWENEFGTLCKTYFIGIGFGTPYVTNQIFWETNNTNMYNIIDGTMVVANHNSIINMFYRLGLIGGILFIQLNLCLVQWFAKKYIQNLNKSIEYNQYLLWGFTNYVFNLFVILMNPGLESPRFSIAFFISIGILISELIKDGERVCGRVPRRMS